MVVKVYNSLSSSTLCTPDLELKKFVLSLQAIDEKDRKTKLGEEGR